VVAAMLAAPTSLWMVAMVSAAEESMPTMPRALEVLPMVFKTLCFDYLQHQEWF